MRPLCLRLIGLAILFGGGGVSFRVTAAEGSSAH